jgi:DNA mismatch repair protein MutS
MPTSETALGGELARLMPGEIVLPERLLARPALFELFAEWKPALTPLANPRFDSEAARRRLENFYGVRALDGFGSFGRAEIAAAGALVDYVALTQQGGAAYLAPPQRVLPGSVMQIDAATRRNLELTASLSGERRGSLLAVIDRTLTGAGARLLAEHLAGPLTMPEAINARLDAVAFFVERPEIRAALRQRLRHCPDIERALSRLSLGRGGPRDLTALRDGLGETAAIRAALAAPGLVPLPEMLAVAEQGLGEHGVLVERLGRALAGELPLFARDGGFIAAGYSFELDQLRELRDDSRRAIAQLQARYAETSGVASLRIRHNNVIGYYVEVSAANAASSASISCTARQWRGRCGTPPSSCRSSKARSPAPPSAPWHWNCGCSRTRRRGHGAAAGDRGGPRPRSPPWTLRRRMPNAPARAIGSGRDRHPAPVSRSAVGGIRRSRRRSPAPAPLSPMIAC